MTDDVDTADALNTRIEEDADARDEIQDARAADLKRREALLRQAGVANL